MRDHPNDIVPTRDSHILPAPSNTSTDIGEAEGPHTPTANSWCGLPNPMWFVFESVHWPKGQDHCLKEHKRTLSSGNTAQSAVTEHAVDQMHEINWKEAEVVYYPPYYCQRCVLETWHIHIQNTNDELWRGPLSIRVQLLDLPTETSCSQTTLNNIELARYWA